MVFKNYLLSATHSYSAYEIGRFKVIDNYIEGQLSANTGLSYDKNRRLIYSGTTPLNSTTTGIFVFNEDYVFQRQLPIYSVQGFDYNPVLDQFIVWSQGRENSTLKTYSYDGTLLYTQSSFDPTGLGWQSGSVCYNYVDDVLLLSTDEVGEIAVLFRSGNNWIFNHYLGAVNPQEGITYDEINDCYWHNRRTEIVKISKAGEVLKVIPQLTDTSTVNEGLAFNPNKNTLYINSDKGYHGGVTDGNRCFEVSPNFY